MKIGFVGAGKVGFSLGKYLTENNVEVVGYYSRKYESACAAAEFTKTEAFKTPKELVEECEMICLTVPDGLIVEIADEIINMCIKEGIDIKDKIFCHMSGALSSEVFSGITANKISSYSIHPLLAVNDKLKSYKEFSKALFTIEGEEKNIEKVKSVFEKMGNKVITIQAKDKAGYHAAAVLGSNLMLGLFETVIEEMVNAGFERKMAEKVMVPFVCNNIEHLKENSMEDALTGPVVRGDVKTVKMHLNMLENDNRKIYGLLSKKALNIAKRKNNCKEEFKEKYEKMEELLNE